ncbi:MAG: imidazole glycerol phosphate synthase subunit HisH [Propionibacteriaceae bacterium]|nr:imidazole glycerol phosphate synthase subunit HisH [Propionibacteriaceae bacterium]
MTTVAILDYGSGNVHSATRAVAATGVDAILTADRDTCLGAAGLVVPGVGAFAACMDQLRAVGGDEIIRARYAAGLPILGICVGHQILFERGVEHGVEADGVGILPGIVERIQAEVLPHMGWNTVQPPAASGLFAGIALERFYFVHSYAVRVQTTGANTWTEYGGDRFLAAVEVGPLSSTQFHPEKSGEAGARLLRNWISSWAN